MRRLPTLLSAAGCCWLCACSVSSLNGSSVDSSQETADGLRTRGEFKRPLARGARLRLEVTNAVADPSTTTLPVTLRAVDPGILGVEGPDIIGVGPGVTSLVLQTPDGVVMDFVHAWVADPSHLEVRRVDENGAATDTLANRITLAVGVPVVVRVEPRSQAQALEGRFAFTFSAGEPVVATRRLEPLEDVELTGLQAGTTILSVEALGHRYELDVEVQP